MKPLFVEIKECIEHHLERGVKNFIIFPFGEVGFQVKNILSDLYGMKPYLIMDNHLCKYNDNIKPLSFLRNFPIEYTAFILAGTNMKIYADLKKSVLAYVDEDAISEFPNHPFNFITTHPFIYAGQVCDDISIDYNLFKDAPWYLGGTSTRVSGSIITKDVPDYAVVAGVPAKILRYRYTLEQIYALNKIKWWDWTDTEIRERYDDFYTPIEDFIKKYLVKVSDKS